MESINPATGELLKSYEPWRDAQLETALAESAVAAPAWRATPFEERARLMRNAAAELRRYAARYGALVALEMGKLLKEARAEVEKCAWGCEYYAGQAAEFLRDEKIETDAGSSYIAYLPLGTILAVMRLAKNYILFGLSRLYIWFFRDTPLYVRTLHWVYF